MILHYSTMGVINRMWWLSYVWLTSATSRAFPKMFNYYIKPLPPLPPLPEIYTFYIITIWLYKWFPLAEGDIGPYVALGGKRHTHTHTHTHSEFLRNGKMQMVEKLWRIFADKLCLHTWREDQREDQSEAVVELRSSSASRSRPHIKLRVNLKFPTLRIYKV